MKTQTKFLITLSLSLILTPVSLQADDSKIETEAKTLEIKADSQFSNAKTLVLVGLAPAALGAAVSTYYGKKSGFEGLVPGMIGVGAVIAGVGISGLGGVSYTLGTLNQREAKKLRGLMSDAKEISQGLDANLSPESEFILSALLMCESCENDQDKIVLTANLINEAVNLGSELASNQGDEASRAVKIQNFLLSAKDQVGADSEEAKLALSQLIVFVDAGFTQQTRKNET